MKNILRITTSAFIQIVKTLGSLPAEKGGVLMGNEDGTITDFIFDKHANTTRGTYELNIPYLNPKIKELENQGKKFLGIIHTHPNGCASLSAQDKKYFKSQFKNFEGLDTIYTPIVFSANDGIFHFHAYIFHSTGEVEETKLEIVPDDYQKYVTSTKEDALVEKAVTLPKVTEITSDNSITVTVQMPSIATPQPTVIIVRQAEAQMPFAKKVSFGQMYHIFLIALSAFALAFIVTLLPVLYQFIKTLLI